MSVFERGSGFSKPERDVDWVRFGPFVVEFWRWWLRLGVCVGCWYVGAYLGPVVVTVGRRPWAVAPVESLPLPLAFWRLTAATIAVERTGEDA